MVPPCVTSHLAASLPHSLKFLNHPFKVKLQVSSCHGWREWHRPVLCICLTTVPQVWSHPRALRFGEDLSPRTRKVFVSRSVEYEPMAQEDGQEERWFEVAHLGENWLSQSRMQSPAGASFAFLLLLTCKGVKRKE